MTDNNTTELLVIKEIKTINDEERIFTGYLSVEVKDRQGEIIPIEELEKTMNTFMKRGGFITKSHSNIIVGKILNWMVKEKNGKPGIFVTGLIFKDYSVDDQVWNDIKTGKYTGLSFGGVSHKKEIKLGDDGKSVGVLRNIEAIECAVVERPANPEAVFEDINFKAKADNPTVDKNDNVNNNSDLSIVNEINKIIEKWEFVQKPLISGHKNFSACVRDMMNKGKTEEQAKKICGYLYWKTHGKRKSEVENEDNR